MGILLNIPLVAGFVPMLHWQCRLGIPCPDVVGIGWSAIFCWNPTVASSPSICHGDISCLSWNLHFTEWNIHKKWDEWKHVYVYIYFIILYYIKLYYIILCYIILYYITLNYIILYYVMLYYIILYYVVLCYVIFILYYIIFMLYYIMLYYIILYHIYIYMHIYIL